jgi:hypothetical protein
MDCLKNIAPNILRQRLLIEGYFTTEVDAEAVKQYLLGLARALDLQVYGEPIVFAPATGMGKDENAGFDAFVPLIDSGISAYVWSKQRFFSIVLYTCKNFSTDKALEFTRSYFAADEPMVHLAF